MLADTHANAGFLSRRFGVPPKQQASLLKTAVKTFRKDSANVPAMATLRCARKTPTMTAS